MFTGETFRALQRAISTNKLLAAATFAVVVTAVASTAAIVQEAGERDRTSAFMRVGDSVTDRIAQQIPIWTSYAGANKDLVALNGDPNPRVMLEFSESLKLSFPSVQSVSIVNRVADQERSDHVSFMR